MSPEKSASKSVKISTSAKFALGVHNQGMGATDLEEDPEEETESKLASDGCFY